MSPEIKRLRQLKEENGKLKPICRSLKAMKVGSGFE
jgi:hypothetical protein